MIKKTQNELAAANLALAAALNDAIIEYQDTLSYKSEYLIKKHVDWETLAELKNILEIHQTEGADILKEIQAQTIEDLRFPVELRKMWSGTEIQEWLKDQAYNKRM
jgi:hypothetical protein